MVHLTGPRPDVMVALMRGIQASIASSGATITEVFRVLHSMQMGAAHKLSEPWDKAVPGSADMFTDAFEGLHHVEMTLVQGMLRPWEDETCPTCKAAPLPKGQS